MVVSEGRAIPRNPAASQREALSTARRLAVRAIPHRAQSRSARGKGPAIRWRGGLATLCAAVVVTIAVTTHPMLPAVNRALAVAQARSAATVAEVTARVRPAAAATAALAAAHATAARLAAEVQAHLPAAVPAILTQSPQPAPVPSASTAAVGQLIVANTGGAGVNVRASPRIAHNTLRAWADGTILVPTGKVAQEGARRWLQVRDPAGNVGWVAAQYVAPR